MNRENGYLLYKHYNINEKDDSTQIMLKVIHGAFLDFGRRGIFPVRTEDSRQGNLISKTEHFLSDKIPNLLQAVNEADNGQEIFDTMHHGICGLIMQIYSKTSAWTYGIAQEWLNFTLLHLTIIESNMETGYWPVKETRKYFHVPVNRSLLESAALKKRRYPYDLGLKCAPVIHDIPDTYQMDWYSHEKTKPVENWDYQEYIEFQNAVRKELKENYVEPNGIYQDCLDWAFQACMARARQMKF